ncbi:hypothetical protein CI109_106122 [Kwoniella shandongensis]|uniref:Uncharacterized protein n=1 Tax=Kwoniella shandongensis TaxID=1734106 RepID=A0A5M6BY38_9TREE|nr:uncharacterized protein CI109_003728 [Kwoniella shandongensis]KAA5527757.1 hypothetical protein CI109_003728 [Kwoniella shandongensis]
MNPTAVRTNTADKTSIVTTLLPTPPLSPTPTSNAVSAVITPIDSPIKPSTPKPIRLPTLPPADSLQLSLHTPLKGHLALLHPATPSPILSFCAKRLLSPDRPYGFDTHGPTEDGVTGVVRSWEWKPIHMLSGGFDIYTAGVGLDAGKEVKQHQNRPGKEADERLEKMYKEARKSWKLLEMKSPIGSAL